MGFQIVFLKSEAVFRNGSCHEFAEKVLKQRVIVSEAEEVFAEDFLLGFQDEKVAVIFSEKKRKPIEAIFFDVEKNGTRIQ